MSQMTLFDFFENIKKKTTRRKKSRKKKRGKTTIVYNRKIKRWVKIVGNRIKKVCKKKTEC